MSCYRQYKSEIKDLGVMQRALGLAGLTSKPNGEITTWGSRRQKVDLAVSEDGGTSFHFGFEKAGNGTYNIVMEQDYIRKSNATSEKAFVERMQTLYATQMVYDGIAAQEGMTLESAVNLDGVYEKGGKVILTVDVADHMLG